MKTPEEKYTPREIQKGLRALKFTSHNPASCDLCGHAPILHVEGVCTVCFFLVGRKDIIVPNKPTRVCTRKFDFRLTHREREQAAMADRLAFEQQDICAACGQYWMNHRGYLCPTGDSTFVKLFGSGESE